MSVIVLPGCVCAWALSDCHSNCISVSMVIDGTAYAWPYLTFLFEGVNSNNTLPTIQYVVTMRFKLNTTVSVIALVISVKDHETPVEKGEH